MSHKQLKFCLACYLTIIAALQFLCILYLTGNFNFRSIDDFTYPCNKTYFYSKIILSKDSYKFSDKSICAPNIKNRFRCIYSDSRIEGYYSESHPLSAADINYLTSLKKNIVYHTNNINEFSNLTAISSLINVAMNKIKTINFKIIKNEIHIITSYLPNKSCDDRAIDTLGDI